MSLICGWLAVDPSEEDHGTLRRMASAMRVHSRQRFEEWTAGRLQLGMLSFDPNGDPIDNIPARSEDGRWQFWFAGEVFRAPDSFKLNSPAVSRASEFRNQFLDELLRKGLDIFREIDGEYHAVLWDSCAEKLTIINDRFGGIPLYWAQSSKGFAFAAAVRAVLAAPDVSAEPDSEALREALTFGGFRLGNRTNVRAVKMVSAATVTTVGGGEPSFRRYRSWNEIKPVTASINEAMDRLDSLWSEAVAIRMRDVKRPGQTLSGGLDSRAIMAEAAPQTSQWNALTFGITGCDDARYAEQAANAVGATWVFQPLYTGRNPDWFDLRSSMIMSTDGMIQLGDFHHLESLSIQARLFDAHISGYIGDAVVGPTFDDVTSFESAANRMPYYGPRFGIAHTDAVQLMEKLAFELNGAPLKFLLFNHKLPQSTNQWTAAWRPWFRVRKPFTDYKLFDFCQGLPASMRSRDAIYERWLLRRYPRLFRDIPNQKTGMPIGTPRWRVQGERAKRYAWRRLLRPTFARLRLPAQERLRYYSADEQEWSKPTVRRRIEATILRKDSISCSMFGEKKVSEFLDDWFERGAAPAQAVGAMYVYEAYHRDLRHFLGDAADRILASANI